MSNNFDPSNLDLDINNTSPTPSENISEKEVAATKTESNIIKQEPRNIPQASDDILGELPEQKIQQKEKPKETKSEDILDDLKVEEKQENNHIEEKPLQKDENKQVTTGSNEEKKKLIDINIETLENLVLLVEDKKYDYVTLEPEDMQVKITFRQDNVEREVKYVKFPVYTNILFKIKQSTGLIIEDTGSPQEGKGKIKIGANTFKLLSKTAPGQNGERIWIKSQKDTSIKGGKKEKKQTSLSTIFGFLGAILFIALILFGVFIGFIVFNAKTVEDVEFFRSLGINLNDINNFIETLSHIVFSILTLIATAALSFALFKFLTTKKVYRQKKIVFGVLSTFLLLVTIGVLSTWMAVYAKIQALPNWLEKERGNLQVFDNTLLINNEFSKNDAYLENTENLIGPVTLKFDLSNFAKDRSNQIYNIKKYSWDLGSEVIETISPELIHTFSETGNYETKITVYGENNKGEDIEQVLSNTPAISVNNTIKIKESITKSGGKKYQFDANSLNKLGEISWYLYIPGNKGKTGKKYGEWTKVSSGYEFFPSMIFFEEAYVGIAVVNSTTKQESLDKIIRLSSEGESEISGEIDAVQDLENQLKYEFSVKGLKVGFANGFIESYEWKVEDKTYSQKGNPGSEESESSVEHVFEKFGQQDIEVTLTDSSGKSETLRKTINIQRQLKLRSFLEITNNGEKIDEIKYEEKTHEFFVDNLGIPTKLQFDARRLRPENILYALKEVSWDIGNNGNIDGTGKVFSYEVPTEGSHSVAVNYTFQHRRNKPDIIEIKEYIFIEGVKKEAILKLKMDYPSNYVPVTVRFDASESFIKNDDIIKFIYDYGDGIIEERDSINPGHRYTKAGDYTVKLTVTGKKGKSYSTQKSLILLPVPQEIEITTSLKKAPVGQGIDFSSAKSTGQIVEYFWDFGDGNISTEANPTHSYDRAGVYTVKLKADFANKNSNSKEVEIEVYEE